MLEISVDERVKVLEETGLIVPINETVGYFDAIYRKYNPSGNPVPWDNHPPTPSTSKAIRSALETHPNGLLIYCLGSGNGGKAEYIVKEALMWMQELDLVGKQIKLYGFDASLAAVDKARSSAEIVGLSQYLHYEMAEILELDPNVLPSGGLVHDYQCAITHTPAQVHIDIIDLESKLLDERGIVVGNCFNNNTIDFYGDNIQELSRGNDYHQLNYHGMTCVFSSKTRLRSLYQEKGFSVEINSQEHPVHKGRRVHWDFMATRQV